MNNFLILTKAFFLNGFQTNNKKKNQKGSFINLGLISLIILALSAFYNFTLFEGASQSNLSYVGILILNLAMASMLSFVFNITQMQGQIFSSKDYEFLESLPVSKKEIVGSKIAAVALLDIAESFLILLPAVILYYTHEQNVYIALISLLSSIFVPLIPLLVASLCGALIAFITKKLKNKTFFSIVLYLLLFAFAFFLSFSLNNSDAIDATVFIKLMPQLNLVISSYDPSNIFMFLIFIFINILSFGFIVLVIALLYTKLNEMYDKSNDKSNYVIGINKEEKLSSVKLLEKKEMKSILHSANWLINSFIGPVVFIMVSVMTIFMNNGKNIPEVAQFEVKYVMGAIIIGMSILINTVSTSTSSSISLEAKNFELLLSYPIDPKDIIKAKINVALKINCLLNLISSTIVSVVISIAYGFNIYSVLSIMIFPHLAYYFEAHIGMICGLKWVKLDFENEIQVIKQGASTGFTTLFGFVPGMLLLLLSIGLNILVLYFNFPVYLPFIIVLVLLFVLCIIAKEICDNVSLKLFNKVITK